MWCLDLKLNTLEGLEERKILALNYISETKKNLLNQLLNSLELAIVDTVNHTLNFKLKNNIKYLKNYPKDPNKSEWRSGNK